MLSEASPQPQRIYNQPMAIQHIKDRFGAMATIMEAESFRKGWINLSLEDLYLRLQQASEDLYVKILKTVPSEELQSCLIAIISSSITGQHGSDAPHIAADLANCLPPPGLFYATIDSAFLEDQVRELIRFRVAQLPKPINNSPTLNNFHPSNPNHPSPINQLASNNDRRYHAPHACVDFIHGRCTRGEGCRFSHAFPQPSPPSRAASLFQPNGSASTNPNTSMNGTIIAGPLNNSFSGPVHNSFPASASASHGDSPSRASYMVNTSQHAFNMPHSHPYQQPLLQDQPHSTPQVASVPPPPPPQAISQPRVPSHPPSPHHSTTYSPYTPKDLAPHRQPPPQPLQQQQLLGHPVNSPVSYVTPLCVDPQVAKVTRAPHTAMARPATEDISAADQLEAFLERYDLAILAESLQHSGFTVASLRELSKSQFEQGLKVWVCSKSLRSALWDALHPDGLAPSTPPLERSISSVIPIVATSPQAEKDRLMAFMASNSIRSTAGSTPDTPTASAATQAIRSLLQLPTAVMPTPPPAATGNDTRAVIWLGGTRDVNPEVVKALVAAVGNCFECGYPPGGGDFMYFKLATYDKDLQAMRFLTTLDGKRLPIVDRTLFAAGHKDDGRPPSPPTEVGNGNPSHAHAVPRREGVGFSPSRDAPICRFYQHKEGCSKGSGCPFRHAPSTLARSPNRIQQRI